MRFIRVLVPTVFVSAFVVACTGDTDSGGDVFHAPETSTFETTNGSIHMVCTGSGPLPVVFLAGGGDSGTVWLDLIDSLGEGVLTCRFDRPGVSLSYDPSGLLAPQDVADALAETLAQAEIGTRFVLVGHSLGGLSLRVFGGSNPDLVAGAVFVDATPPSFATASGTSAELLAFGFDPAATGSQGTAVTTWSSDAIVTVLTHDPVVAGWTTELQAAWDIGQTEYAALTANGTLTVVPGAGHYIFQDEPVVVTEAIEALLP